MRINYAGSSGKTMDGHDVHANTLAWVAVSIKNALQGKRETLKK